MPPKQKFSTNSRSSGQPKNWHQNNFFHPPSPYAGNFCNYNNGGICTTSQFWVQLPLCEATSTQKSARKWCCNLSQLCARKITKGIHSCKPASLNRPIKEGSITDKVQVFLWSSGCCVNVKVYKGGIYNWPGPGFLEVVRFLCECEGV